MSPPGGVASALVRQPSSPAVAGFVRQFLGKAGEQALQAPVPVLAYGLPEQTPARGAPRAWLRSSEASPSTPSPGVAVSPSACSSGSLLSASKTTASFGHTPLGSRDPWSLDSCPSSTSPFGPLLSAAEEVGEEWKIRAVPPPPGRLCGPNVDDMLQETPSLMGGYCAGPPCEKVLDIPEPNKFEQRLMDAVDHDMELSIDETDRAALIIELEDRLECVGAAAREHGRQLARLSAEGILNAHQRLCEAHLFQRWAFVHFRLAVWESVHVTAAEQAKKIKAPEVAMEERPRQLLRVSMESVLSMTGRRYELLLLQRWAFVSLQLGVTCAQERVRQLLRVSVEKGLSTRQRRCEALLLQRLVFASFKLSVTNAQDRVRRFSRVAVDKALSTRQLCYEVLLLQRLAFASFRIELASARALVESTKSGMPAQSIGEFVSDSCLDAGREVAEEAKQIQRLDVERMRMEQLLVQRLQEAEKECARLNRELCWASAERMRLEDATAAEFARVASEERSKAREEQTRLEEAWSGRIQQAEQGLERVEHDYQARWRQAEAEMASILEAEITELRRRQHELACRATEFAVRHRTSACSAERLLATRVAFRAWSRVQRLVSSRLRAERNLEHIVANEARGGSCEPRSQMPDRKENSLSRVQLRAATGLQAEGTLHLAAVRLGEGSCEPPKHEPDLQEKREPPGRPAEVKFRQPSATAHGGRFSLHMPPLQTALPPVRAAARERRRQLSLALAVWAERTLAAREEAGTLFPCRDMFNERSNPLLPASPLIRTSIQ